MKFIARFSLAAVCIAALATPVLYGQQSASGLTADTLKTLEFRNLGPTLNTGRIVDIAIDQKDPNTWYVAAAFGGVWKTKNRGITWDSIFDDYGFTTCCVVIDPKNSDVLWVGSGENASQRSAHYGDGVYKSTDGGKTFTNMGLKSSEHIGKIIVDPRNSNVVWVASQGPLFSEGGERSLYKTTDGGATWTASLTITKDTGVSDIVLDPRNPDIILAGSYQRRRAVGQMIGGGDEGGIWKSMDGGKKWTKLTNGLPKGEVGRIALAVDPKVDGKKPPIFYAIVHAKADERGFYKSVDGGTTWTKESNYVGGGAAYYAKLFVDPYRPDTIWSANTPLEWSRDAGKTWSQVPNMHTVGLGSEAQYVHVDFHQVTFDPVDKNHVLVSSDGGLHETYDFERWRFFPNLPITQFYKIDVDDAKPFYRVCGGAQDNFSVCGPSRTRWRWGIRPSDWFYVSSGDGFQPRLDPNDSNTVYGQSQDGNIQRNDLRTGQATNVKPNRAAGRGAGGGRGGGTPDPNADRANWDTPYLISPHSSNRLYWASQFVYRSDDRGDSWTKISPDLTRNLDWKTLPIMGKVWPADSISLHESTTALSNVVSLDESPLLEGLIYAGTDDGLLQITEDGGKNWRKVEDFQGLPKWTYVSDIFASPRDANVVFVAFNNWQRGDYKPYIYRSNDRGRTFTSISGNLPSRNDVWGIIQDHINGDLLFAGTEWGAYTSVDGGRSWLQLKGNMPVAQVRDIQVQKSYSDLILGTFGRGFWVLDDYSPLRAMTAQTLAQEATLYPTREFVPLYNVVGESQASEPMWSAANPTFGAVLTYSVGKEIADDAKLVMTITDNAGKQVRRFDVPKELGLHRAAWNLRVDGGVTQVGGPGLQEPAEGPKDDDDDQQQTPPPAGRGGGGAPQGRGAGAAGAPQAGGGRGAGQGGAIAVPGRYTATLGKQIGDTVTPYGVGVSFVVKNVDR